MRGARVPVKAIALELSYDSASAFIALFRRTLWTPPGALHRCRDTANVIFPQPTLLKWLEWCHLPRLAQAQKPVTHRLLLTSQPERPERQYPAHFVAEGQLH
jgi:hypothetical protein